MFGIGITEIIVILVVALLVVGPKKLPELAKTLGRTMAEFRKTADDFKESIYQDESTLETDSKRAEEVHKTSKILYPVDPVDDEASGELKAEPKNGESVVKSSDRDRQEESAS
jgi:sec-independent protein translocase protein TatB